MRRPALPSLVSAAALTGTLALAGCGGSADAPAATPTTPSGVTATGAFGEKPDITVPSGKPPAKLTVDVLQQGDGATVAKGDLVVVDYLGQTWAPKDGQENVFDNSYDKGTKAAFPIGVGAVVKGWDQALVGQKIGSRVLLTIPPAEGYGSTARDPIPANSTLVFVVDLVEDVDVSQGASGTPVTGLPATVPKVTDNGPGKAPTITVPKGSPPAEPVSTVLVEGDGEPLDLAGTLVAQAVQVNWVGGAVTGSTYGRQPLTLTPPQLAGIPGLAAALQGAKAGTRVVVTLPAKLNAGTPAVVVLDLVADY